MTTTTVIRSLAPSEEIFAPGEVYVGYSLRLTGWLDLHALASAFDTLLESHPILTARLDCTDTGHVLLESAGATPDISVVDGDPELLLTGALLDQRTAVCGLCVVRDGDALGLTLVTHHCIADAFHSLTLLRELCHYYCAAVQGNPLIVRPHPYPRQVEALLADRGVVKIPDPLTLPRSLVPESLAALQDSADTGYLLPRTTRCRLTREQTAALVELGHREGLTVNALTSAAILLTEAELRELPLGELVYTYSVDLRTRLVPTVGATDGTNVLGFATYAPALDTEPTLLGVARGVQDSLRAGLAAGFVQQTPLHIPDISAAGPPRIPGVVLATNWGRVPHPPLPPELTVTDFRSTMIAKPDRTGRRPDKPDEGTCIISTFHDRLSIELHHPESTKQRHVQRVGILTDHLHAAISAA